MLFLLAEASKSECYAYFWLCVIVGVLAAIFDALDK